MKHTFLSLLTLMIVFSSCKKDKEEDKQAYIDFSYSGNISSTIPVTVNFTSTPNDNGTVEWDFGDGTVGTGVTVSHTYDSAGIYDVYARLITSYGTAGKTRTINVCPYTKMKVYQVEGVCPPLKPDNTTWDSDGSDTQPDIYFRLYNSTYHELAASTPQTNTFSTVYTVTQTLEFMNFDDPFIIRFLDKDPAQPADDAIGEFQFRPGDYFNGTGNFPNVFTKTDANGTSVTVRVLWLN